MKRKKRPIWVGACVLAIGMCAMLSGCKYGVSDTVDLVKSAEQAKQAVERMSNGEDKQVSVGTPADPNYVAKTKLELEKFEISCSGTEFTAAWDLNSSFDQVKVQIYADTDDSGEDGTKIASVDSAPCSSSQTFRYQLLDDGTYFCYIKVTAEDGTSLLAYCETPVYVELESPEGSLENISIQPDGEDILFTWDPGEHDQYIAMLIDPKDKSTILQETTVIEPTARLSIPSDMDYVYAAVAAVEDGRPGPYRIYKIVIADEKES